MKLLLSFVLASSASGLVIPGASTFLSSEAGVRSRSPSVWSIYPDKLVENIEWAVGKLRDELHFGEADLLGNNHGSIRGSLDPSRRSLKSSDFIPVKELAANNADNDKSNLTLYQTINNSEHFTVFAKLVSEFDDIVKKLNSSLSTHSVFVPTDEAFEKYSHAPKPPKEYLKSFIEYHISPDVLPLRKVFSSRTIPTLLEQSELGPYPQRISIQLGIRGLTLNYMSHPIRPNIEAKNGIIHALDHVLIPPFMASDTLNFLTPWFSSFEFGLMKTGLLDEINKTSTHTGATFFLPTNEAFKKLPAPVTGFLFSRWGGKYLKALLKYHIVFGHTLYSDAYNKPKDDQFADQDTHVDLPTLLEDKHLSIDIKHYNRFYSMKVNGFTTVAASDIIVKDGVMHVLSDVVFPPRKPHKQQFGDQDSMQAEKQHVGPDDAASLTIDEVIERLEPLTE